MESLALMPKYEAYKDSYSDYSGLIPCEWKLIPIRAIFEERNEKNTGPKTDHILSVTRDRGVIPYDEKGAIGNNKSEDIERYKLVYENDLVINKMNVVIGSLGLSKYFGALSQVYIVLRPKTKSFNIRYYAYLFHNEPFYKSLIRYCTGIMELRESLNKEQFKQLYLPFPTFEEQTLIANFLDKKTAQIDDAIAIKEQQISLLKDRKQIIIQQAVTQGLNPDVPMKDSGVDWIGKIPAHWEVRRAKYIFDEVDERSQNGDEELLSVSHMTGVTPRSEKNVSMFMAEDYTGSKLCIENDLVINIMWAWMGALGVSDRVGIVSPSYGVFRQKLKNTFNPTYLEYLLKSVKYVEYYNKVSTGLHSSRLRFYGHMLFAMKMGYPSYEEQNEIMAYLHEQTKRIDLAIDSQLAQIEKLKEYKTTLINSAVTGKIKVTPEMVEQ